ncbi:Imm3 family immunity protein [Ornithobacterium rhinotracheale]|uniref:Imm3 family immunity protein n=1 Tax=Ornithobacterium rhinotracheale TaxID=28251 RepID=UPI004036F761
MKNWKYKELLDAINETFDEQLLQGLSPLEAIGVTSENFMFHPSEDNKVENLITLIETIFLCLNNLNFVYETTVEKYNKQKKILTEKEIKNSLLKDEYDLLMKRLGELEFKLVHSEIKQIF